MPRGLSFGKTGNRTQNSQKKKPLKGFKKLTFRSCLGNSSRQYHPNKMSNLQNALNISAENITLDDKYGHSKSEEVTNINVAEKGNSEKNKKTIKVKITIKEENRQGGQKQIKTTDSSTPLNNYKTGNRNICISDEFDGDSISLVSKSPSSHGEQKRMPCLKDTSRNFIEMESPKSKLCDVKSYDSELPVDTSNDSLIVHDIIMERYRDVLSYLNNKSAKKDSYRRSISLRDDKEKCEVAEDMKHPLSISLCQDIKTQINKKSLDSGLHDITATKSTDTSKSLDENEEQTQYNSKEFLLAALGEDLMNIETQSEDDLDISSKPASSMSASKYDTQKSIGSSQISSLVSSTDCKSGIESLYSTVNKASKKKPALVKKKPVVRSLYASSAYDHYESVEFRVNPKVEQLTRDISTFQGIVSQALNAVNVCKQDPKLYGSIHHLEAERILLVSTCKLEMLKQECSKCEYEEVEKVQSCGTIEVRQVRFSTTPPIRSEKSATQYYLCTVQSGTTVLASEITSANKDGEILFRKSNHLNFDTLLSEVEINVSIYSISIRNMVVKNTSCFARNKMYSSWKTKKEGNNNNDSSFSQISGIQLLGNSRIGFSELTHNDKFMLNNIPLYSSISESFEADIGIKLRMDNKFSGFLTIRTKNILWNRRWCVLEGYLLKYWNWPSEESERNPLGVIDLQKCVTENVSSVDRSVCSRSRTFVLKPQETSSEQYFLSADNPIELSQWIRRINVTLTTIRQLKMLKCETVLL